jgi:RNA polymerase sigma-70 factor (ECF subfamily)
VSEPTDAELVARCLEAKEAFELLYRRHAPAVFAFLKAMNRGDPHAAADVLQETFLRAFDALARFDTSRPLRPWLFTIAANACRDALAKGRRVETRDPATLGTEAPVADADPARRALVSDACASLLRLAGERLPARVLATFLLARAHGFTNAEVAEMQGCSLATVKRDLSDALATLTGAAAELGLV